MSMAIKSVLARDSSADPADILTVKRMLNRLGHYVPEHDIGMTGFADAALFEALKAFQKRNDLPETAKIAPDDDTWKALFDAYSQPPGDDDAYIWMTMDDDRVRASHAARAGLKFLWKDRPVPGEESGCRCWALPIQKKVTLPETAVAPEQPVLAPWLRTVLSDLRESEGDIEYPYGDSKGVITGGIGTNIDQEAVFLSLPWRIGTVDGRLATAAEINEGYRALKKEIDVQRQKAAAQNQPTLRTKARHYESTTNLRLPAATSEQLATRDLTAFLRELNKKFPDFNRFPVSARVALMDMIYNIGGTKFTAAKWPSLFTAVSTRDWDRAAAESHRADVNAQRNAQTEAYFRQAAAIETSVDR